MERLPPYLTVVNPDEGAPQGAPAGRRNRKRRIADTSKGKGPATSSVPSPKKAQIRAPGGSPIPSSTILPQLGQHAPRVIGDLTLDADVGGNVEPPSPPPSSPFRFPRGFLWEKGCSSDELSVAFLPPRRFQDVHLPLTVADERVIHHAQDELVKGVGLLQSLLLLKKMVVGLSAEKRRIEATRDAADAARKRMEGELETAKAAAVKAEAEVQTLKAEVSQKSAELSSALEGLKSSKDALAQLEAENASLKTSNALGVDAVKTLTLQRGRLAEEMGGVKAELEDVKKTLSARTDMVKATAKDAFNMALALVHHFNPSATLDLSKVDWRAYIYQGKYVPPPPSPNRTSVSDLGEEKEQGEAEEEVTLGASPDVVPDSVKLPFAGDAGPGPSQRPPAV